MNTLFVGHSLPMINFCKSHSHPCWEIVIPISGAGHVKTETEDIEFCKEGLYIIPPTLV